MAEEKIEKIEKISKATKSNQVEKINPAEELERVAPNKEKFDNLINQEAPQKVAQQPEPVAKNSLLDEVRNLNQRVDSMSKVSPSELVAQSDKVIHQIESIKKQLATPNLQLNPATQNLMQNKLAHIDENLRVAMSKAGLEYNPSDALDNKTVNPIDRFLGFLTNGQEQLASLSTEIQQMQFNDKTISPANMLRIQMKMAYVTQEIEFFTSALNKALDSTKTIMNVQV